MDTGTNCYPSFEYSAGQLSAFACSLGTFTISLKNGTIVSFRPDHAEDFKNWLMSHGIRDISMDHTPTPKRRRRLVPLPFLSSGKIKRHEPSGTNRDCTD